MLRINPESIAVAALAWLLLTLLEIALVGKVDPQETPVGAGVAALATAAMFVSLRAAHLHYTVRASWLGFGLLIARNVVRDTLVVFGVLFRRLAGGAVADAYQDVPFDAGTGDPASAMRRALVIAGVSTSPNEIALDIDAERGTLRVHALAVTGAARHSKAWPL